MDMNFMLLALELCVGLYGTQEIELVLKERLLTTLLRLCVMLVLLCHIGQVCMLMKTRRG